jgi:hypothetical protein
MLTTQVGVNQGQLGLHWGCCLPPAPWVFLDVEKKRCEVSWTTNFDGCFILVRIHIHSSIFWGERFLTNTRNGGYELGNQQRPPQLF